MLLLYLFNKMREFYIYISILYEKLSTILKVFLSPKFKCSIYKICQRKCRFQQLIIIEMIRISITIPMLQYFLSFPTIHVSNPTRIKGKIQTTATFLPFFSHSKVSFLKKFNWPFCSYLMYPAVPKFI